jgi:hypothetical protein
MRIASASPGRRWWGGHMVSASLDALAIVQLRKADNSVAHGIEVAEPE